MKDMRLKYKVISQKDIAVALTAVIMMPLVLIIFGIISAIYFVVPMYLAHHPYFGRPFNYIIDSTVYILMWSAVLYDGYDVIKAFYLPTPKEISATKRKKLRKVHPVVPMFFSYLYSIYSFSVAYSFISTLWPSTFGTSISISIIDSLYFSVATATTIGYGDITPKTDCAKIVVMIQALVSLSYVIFIFSACSTYLRDRVNREK